MRKKISIDEAEKLLAKKFKGAICSFTYPGYKTVNGMVEEISIDTRTLPAVEVSIQMNDKVYSVSLECLRECLKIKRRGNIR